ncbi:hypothetical protein HK405_009480, partial [Cladochytrium tenue]
MRLALASLATASRVACRPATAATAVAVAARIAPRQPASCSTTPRIAATRSSSPTVGWVPMAASSSSASSPLTEAPAPARRENRLARERSPYLLQHRFNPVDWYPWGEEAFEKARSENKPILLSVGYSTCHWCHVMEHESFENEDVARVQNDLFVRPMTVMLTPELKPFFGGTYFPPMRKFGTPGYIEILTFYGER